MLKNDLKDLLFLCGPLSVFLVIIIYDNIAFEGKWMSLQCVDLVI